MLVHVGKACGPTRQPSKNNSLPPPVFPLIPVFIPMIIDLADGTTPETDLIITRNVDPITGDVTGGM